MKNRIEHTVTTGWNILLPQDQEIPLRFKGFSVMLIWRWLQDMCRSFPNKQIEWLKTAESI